MTTGVHLQGYLVVRPGATNERSRNSADGIAMDEVDDLKNGIFSFVLIVFYLQLPVTLVTMV